MYLHNLIGALPVRHCNTCGRESDNLKIKDITDDSRNVSPGCLFILRGKLDEQKTDYVADAIARGAVAVIAQKDAVAGLQIKLGKEKFKNTALCSLDVLGQKQAGNIANVFFDFPSSNLDLIGITGTNGKTTISYILRHLLNSAGIKTGLIGTIETDSGDGCPTPSSLTTPGAVEFTRLLYKMVKNGCKAAAVEVSSHALLQGRVAGLEFNGAIFTNLSGDHLDYHKTMENYASAKAKLFEYLPADGFAVLNEQDEWSSRMIENCKALQIWTTLDDKKTGTNKAIMNSSKNADYDKRTRWIAHIDKLSANGSKVVFENDKKSYALTLPLAGRHNVSNTLQAFAAAEKILEGQIDIKTLETCAAPPGRMELISKTVSDTVSAKRYPTPFWGPTVIVDYAHTHDALENVLSALKPLTDGRLIAVIGCGGDRDKTKRPKMAKAACTYADKIYLTSDNPRTEDPEKIIEDMRSGIPDNCKDVVVIEPDRALAINAAIKNSASKDCILIAGKGHETYQILGTKKIHFDDREQAAKALANR